MEPKTKKPTTILLKVTIPTQETFIEGIKQMFPMVEIEVEGEAEEDPSESPQ